MNNKLSLPGIGDAQPPTVPYAEEDIQEQMRMQWQEFVEAWMAGPHNSGNNGYGGFRDLLCDLYGVDMSRAISTLCESQEYHLDVIMLLTTVQEILDEIQTLARETVIERFEDERRYS